MFSLFFQVHCQLSLQESRNSMACHTSTAKQSPHPKLASPYTRSWMVRVLLLPVIVSHLERTLAQDHTIVWQTTHSDRLWGKL